MGGEMMLTSGRASDTLRPGKKFSVTLQVKGSPARARARRCIW